MTRILLLAALIAGCGDGSTKKLPDAGGTQDATMPDAAMSPDTLTSYVIDLVQHHTNGTETPRSYSEFSSLNDPDGSNGSAYAPLF